MASFDIKSELDHHEVTNAVDQANRVLQNKFNCQGRVPDPSNGSYT